MDVYDVLEAERIISVIRANLQMFPDISEIWLDHEDLVVVVVAKQDALEYAMSIEEFVRAHAPRH